VTTTCCMIGAWPDREAIEAEIRAEKMGIRAIAKKYKTTKFAVEKHRRCMGVVGGLKARPPSDPDEGADELLPGEDGFSPDPAFDPKPIPVESSHAPENVAQTTADGQTVNRPDTSGENSENRPRPSEPSAGS
jgi:hypothetical protein